jgi:hypothetical protein
MNSTLPIYYSKNELTLRFADYFNVFVLPTICLIGMLTSLATWIVALRIKKRDHILKYILTNSLIDFSFLMTQIFLPIFRCGTLCPFGYRYAAKFYELYIYLFFGYVLITFQAIFNFKMTLERLKIFSNGPRHLSNAITQRARTPNETSIFQLIVFFIVAILINAPNYLFSKEIIPFGIYKSNETMHHQEVLYRRNIRELFKTEISETLLIILAIIASPGFYMVTGVLNTLVAVKFRNFVKNKRAMTVASASNDVKMDKKEPNFTIIILLSYLVYLIGNSVDSVITFLILLDVDIYIRYGFVALVNNALFFSSHAIKFIIYYKYNKTIRRKLVQSFGFISGKNNRVHAQT